ncbi:hypothetical protein SAMN02745866_03758 [Alteromonadaceae bacterium Bs31]|nr:hypothetical protein SAMN02745866_03758 [Alteromonadaceae bacterium Bs31]
MSRKPWFACLTLLLLTLLQSKVFAAHHEGESTPQEPAAPAEQSVAATNQYSCTLQGLVRRVEIAYATDGTGVPCDVNYYKDSEAPDAVSTLWSAQNLEGYCEQKANEFVAKLQSWGWECTAK